MNFVAIKLGIGDRAKYIGMLKAVGYGLGVGLAAASGTASSRSELAFLMPGWLVGASAAAVSLIGVISSPRSIRKGMRLEPAIVSKS